RAFRLGPEQVWADGAGCGTGESDRVGDRVEVVAHQDDVGRLQGDVGAGDDAEAEVRGGQGGRVVDAVPDHRHPVTGPLQLLDRGDLLRGQHPGPHLCDPPRL